MTPQRMAVWDFLCGTTVHPTADMVFKALRPAYPGLSFDTVNRTLITFAEKGLVNILPGDGDPRRYDADMSDHHHFRCIGCGKVFDTFDERLNDVVVPLDLQDFTILSRSVMFRGYCPACTANSE